MLPQSYCTQLPVCNSTAQQAQHERKENATVIAVQTSLTLHMPREACFLRAILHAQTAHPERRTTLSQMPSLVYVQCCCILPLATTHVRYCTKPLSENPGETTTKMPPCLNTMMYTAPAVLRVLVHKLFPLECPQVV
eukprot:15266-Heterococcus_DN1.PRE.2